MENPILVTGAAGRVGAVGRTVTELLLKQGKAVRATVRNEYERAQALRTLGAEVVIGDLLDLDSMRRVIAGCETMYFSMSVSDAYLAATVNSRHTVQAIRTCQSLPCRWRRPQEEKTGDSAETFSAPAAVITAKESRQVLLTPEPIASAGEAAQFLCVKRRYLLESRAQRHRRSLCARRRRQTQNLGVSAAIGTRRVRRTE